MFLIFITLFSVSCEKEKVTPSTTSIPNNDTSSVSNTLAKVDFFGVYMFKSDYYEGEKDLVLTESTLNSLKQLIVESKKDMSLILKEALINTTPEKREIIKDFMIYIEEA